MNKQRIGILCFWGVPNFGAWVQAYALNNIASQIAGSKYRVEHINYLHPRHIDSYYKNDMKLKSNFSYSYYEINHTEILSAEELEKQFFDIIITGSDAIWDFSIDVFGNDKHLIGNALNTAKLIAYAPSFGTMALESEFEDWVKEGLKRYNYLSVRDQNSAGIIQRLTGQFPPVLLDPALLWDFNEDKNVVEPYLKPYILVYGAKWTDEFIYASQKLAKKRGCQLVSVGYTNKWCDLNYRKTELRGMEWVGMFKNASIVITSMFHGLMLSISFGKQVKFCSNSYVRNRVRSLLQALNLQIYLKEMPDIKEIFDTELDYNQINCGLQKLRKNSLAYLKQALTEQE